ncbi:MAG: BatD family protein [Parachlamydiaceae bacterium]
MVRQIILIILLFPCFLFAGEFTASVSRNHVTFGEGLTLTLVLKGAAAKDTPSISALKNSFIINSQQQSANTMITNGQVSSTITWKLVLIPEKEGDAVIPSLSINTSEGTLTTKPITIRVVKGTYSADTAEEEDSLGVSVATDVGNAKPYKNEPFVFSVKLASQSPLANVSMQKITMEDALVQVNGEPKVSKKVVNGLNVGVIEFSYLITPTKAGPLKIPSAIIQGWIQVSGNTRSGSFMDDSFDPFSMMLGFNRTQPFTLTAEGVTVEVQPAVAGMIPWLPAKSLKIEEVWDPAQTFQAGDPFSRGFKIVAEGVQSSQLPTLNDLQISSPSFKMYADKPELGDEVNEGHITSYRKEQYTFIPQKSGTLTLPEISVTWWDVTKNERVVTKIPSRSVHVIPALQQVSSSEHAAAESVVAPFEMPPTQLQGNPILYTSIAGLGSLLLGAVLWGIALQKKISRLTAVPVMSPPAKVVQKIEVGKYAPPPKANKATPVKDKNEKLPNLNPT